MKKATTLLLAIILGIITSNAQTYEWARSMGGPDNDIGFSIAVDNSGNVYTVGRLWGTVDFDPGVGTSFLTSAGGYDIFISKAGRSRQFPMGKKHGWS